MPLKLTKRPGSDVWYIRGTVSGCRVFETTGTKEKKFAQEFRAKREAQLYEEQRLGRRAAVPFVSAAALFLEFEDRSSTTETDVLRLADHFGSRDVATIEQAEADAAASAIYGTTVSPATRRRHVYTPLISVLTFAAGRKWRELPKIKKPKEVEHQTRWITPAEAVRLLDGSAAHLRPLIQFILSTGARMSEALDLQWTDIDLNGARAVFRDTKTGADRIASLPPAAVVSLANMPFTDEKRQVREGAVFRKEDGKPYASRNREGGGQIKTGWRGACKRAGLAIPKLDHDGNPVLDAKERPLMVPSLTPHDLRHTWATWFYGITKDLLLLKAEGAWAELSMVERYAHLMPSDLAADVHLVWGGSHPRIGVLPMRNGANSVHPSQETRNSS